MAELDSFYDWVLSAGAYTSSNQEGLIFKNDPFDLKVTNYMLGFQGSQVTFSWLWTLQSFSNFYKPHVP